MGSTERDGVKRTIAADPCVAAAAFVVGHHRGEVRSRGSALLAARSRACSGRTPPLRSAGRTLACRVPTDALPPLLRLHRRPLCSLSRTSSPHSPASAAGRLSPSVPAVELGRARSPAASPPSAALCCPLRTASIPLCRPRARRRRHPTLVRRLPPFHPPTPAARRPYHACSRGGGP